MRIEYYVHPSCIVCEISSANPYRQVCDFCQTIPKGISYIAVIEKKICQVPTMSSRDGSSEIWDLLELLKLASAYSLPWTAKHDCLQGLECFL